MHHALSNVDHVLLRKTQRKPETDAFGIRTQKHATIVSIFLLWRVARRADQAPFGRIEALLFLVLHFIL